jgi:hypothetical protein
MLRLRSFLAAALLPLALATGCQIKYTPADSPDAKKSARRVLHGQAESHAEIEERYFPKTVASLAKADDALAAQRYDDALAAAQQAADTIKDESSDYGVAAREARERLRLQAWAWEGQALQGLGRDMDALIAVGSESRWPGSCRIDLRPRCTDYAKWIKGKFPGVIKDENIVAIAVVDTLPIAQGNYMERMESFGETIRMDKAEYRAAYVEPTSVKPGKDQVTLRVDGETSTVTYEECVKTGTLRVGDANFDVKRCGDRTGVLHRADFVTTVPPGDAAKITGAKGERVLIVFQVKNFKRTGIVYTVGPSRVAYVSAPPQR